MADNENIEVNPTIEVEAEVHMGGQSSEYNAEAWAVGERGGVPVSSTDQTYHNNSKYYAGEAAASAEAIGQAQQIIDGYEEDSEAYATGKRNGTDVSSDDPAYHNNSKYYAGEAASSATAASGSADAASGSAGAASGSANAADGSAKDSEAYAVGKRGGTDVASDDPAYHNNSKYYAGEAASSATAASGSADAASGSAGAASGSANAADGSAKDSEAYAVGKRGGTDVASDDPAYHNNSKYYAGEAASSATAASGSADAASGSAGAASGSANAADGSAKDSEAYAVGKRGGTDVASDDPSYHNNSKYYAEEAGSSASAASGSATAAEGSAEDAEAWAVGKRDGTDVPSTDPTYENNAKHYAGEASSSASAASGSATAAEGSAEDAEAWAVGKRDGTDVPSTDPTYENNAKHYAAVAQAAAQQANAEALYRALAAIGIGVENDIFVIQPVTGNE